VSRSKGIVAKCKAFRSAPASRRDLVATLAIEASPVVWAN